MYTFHAKQAWWYIHSSTAWGQQSEHCGKSLAGGSKASSCKCYVPRRDLLFTYVQHKAMIRERFSSRLHSPPTVCLDRSQTRLVTTSNVAKKKRPPLTHSAIKHTANGSSSDST